MIKKLRLKFILTNMLLVGTVLLIVFVSVCALTYRVEKENTEAMMESAMLSFVKKEPPFLSDRPSIGGAQDPWTLVYVVLTDEKGNILRTYDTGTHMEEDVLQSALTVALQKGKRDGLLSSYGIYYMKRELPIGTMVAFASAVVMQTTVKNTVFIFSGVCLCALLLFLCISIVLAELTIRPIEEAWRRQKQFVADASHDLKTPLTVILANNNILTSHINASNMEDRKWLESTEEEAGRMRGLIDKMLALADSEDMSSKLVMRKTEIDEVVEAVVLQFEPVAFEKGVTIESEIANDICIESDADALIRLIHILLDNAIKYSAPESVVRVTLFRVKQSVRLCVQNDGVIASSDLPHLFERFYRADKARGVGGFGLGLSIAKNIAENLGGSILVESNEQIGTKFTVVLKR